MAEIPRHRDPDDASPSDEPPRDRSRILSIDIRIRYCHANGRQREMVIDTTKVKGITWDVESFASTLPGKADKDPKNRLRFTGTPEDLGPCPEESEEPEVRFLSISYSADDAVCCWWDGTQWICPDEVE
jgi:hypothetical protein